MSTAIFWFRQDLRLSDNPAFLQACEQYTQVLPIYIDDYSTQDLPLGEASRVWLHHSLDKLKHSLQDHHSDLLLFQGDAKAILMELVSQLDAEAVLWNRCYDPHSIERDTAIKAALKAESILAHSENASLLNEPWQILKKDGTPYRVYTPYWKQVHGVTATSILNPTKPLCISRQIVRKLLQVKPNKQSLSNIRLPLPLLIPLQSHALPAVRIALKPVTAKA